MRKPILLAVVVLLLGVLLAACVDDDTTIPQPQPSTPQGGQTLPPTSPLPTRIVTLTPRPTALPTAAPTLPYDVTRYEGTWTLLLRYEVNNSRFFDQIIYTASVGIIIGLDGSVFGSGQFKPVFNSFECAAQIVNADGLTFGVTGSLRPSGETVFLDLTLQPTNPEFEEEYTIICFDQLNRSEKRTDLKRPILWSILTPADQLHFSFDLDAAVLGASSTYEGNIATLTRNDLEGTLVGEVQLSR